jgi:hypothetical protein
MSDTWNSIYQKSSAIGNGVYQVSAAVGNGAVKVGQSVKDTVEPWANDPTVRKVAIATVGATAVITTASVGLPIMGFTAAGVKGGSIAAAWMSSVGITFAILSLYTQRLC